MQRRFVVPALLAAAVGVGMQPAVAGGQGTLQDIVDKWDCTPGLSWHRSYPSFSRRVLSRTEPIQRNENRTGRTQQATFTSTRTRTIEHGVSAGMEAKVGGFAVLEASIEASWKIDVVSAKTARVDNQQSVSVPPHNVAVGAYGVYTRTFSGEFVRRARAGDGGAVNKKCPQLRHTNFVATFPLDEVGWVVKTFPVR
jgi:hypothetical protein